MAGCGSCSSFVGGRRRKTRKSHRKRHRGGNPLINSIKSALGMGESTVKAVGHEVKLGAENVTSMAGGRRRKSMRKRKTMRKSMRKRAHYRHPKKGQRSRTRKGRLDFTTKKSSKGVKRRPFRTHRRR
jgi:NADPH-dependent glutamate synthase beta subunit-like oxidoreductase